MDHEPDILAYAEDLVSDLEQRGIIARLFGGVGILYYLRQDSRDVSRLCADVDLVVADADFREVVGYLRNLGWFPLSGDPLSPWAYQRLMHQGYTFTIDLVSENGPLLIPINLQGGLQGNPVVLSRDGMLVSLLQTPRLSWRRVEDILLMASGFRVEQPVLARVRLLVRGRPHWWIRCTYNLVMSVAIASLRLNWRYVTAIRNLVSLLFCSISQNITIRP